MKKVCITAVFLSLATACAFAQEQPANKAKEVQVRLRDLRRDVANLSLLNRMKLTLEQVRQVKTLVEGLKLARELKNQQVLACQEQMVEVLEEARELLAAGARKLPDKMVERYNRLRKKIGKATKKFSNKLEKADKELNTALTPQQCEAAENYDGDPLRPKEEADRRKKARVAQVIKVLNRLRAALPGQLEKIRGRLVGQLLGKLTQERNVPGDYVQAARRKVEQIVQEARQMDEIDYLLWQEELAQEVLDATRRPRPQPRWQGKKQKGPKLSKAGTILLNEGMLGALKAKIEALEKAERAKQEKPAAPRGGKDAGEKRKL